MRRNNRKLSIPTLSGSKELIVESLKLPKDTMLGASIVTLTGNREAFIENYKGIKNDRLSLLGLSIQAIQIGIRGLLKCFF